MLERHCVYMVFSTHFYFNPSLFSRFSIIPNGVSLTGFIISLIAFYAWYVEADTFPPRPVQLTWMSSPSGYFLLAYSGLIWKV